MNLRLITDPSTIGEPLTLARAKAYLNIDLGNTADDDLIAGHISAARIMAETVNGRQMAAAQFEVAFDAWPGTLPVGMTSISSPYFGFWPSDAYLLYNGTRPVKSALALTAPLTSVQSLGYTDATGTWHAMTENTDYVVDVMKEPGIIAPTWNKSWPTADLWPTSAIRCKFTSGYGAYSGTVNTSGTAVTLVSGFQFSPLFDGRLITINGQQYTFTYATAATGTLSDTAGTQSAVAYSLDFSPPAPIATGMKRLVSQWYEKRMPFDAIRFVAEIPFDVRALFQHDMLVRF
jgi:hypothetical protein